MQMHESAEDYLERILMLEQDHAKVRSIDIAEGLSVSKPSVSIALKKLREAGLVEMEHSGAVHLTHDGREIARKVYARHTLLTNALTAIGVEPDKAAEEACRIEHDISDETYLLLSKYYQAHAAESV